MTEPSPTLKRELSIVLSKAAEASQTLEDARSAIDIGYDKLDGVKGFDVIRANFAALSEAIATLERHISIQWTREKARRIKHETEQRAAAERGDRQAGGGRLATAS